MSWLDSLTKSTAESLLLSDLSITVRDPVRCGPWYAQTFKAEIADPDAFELDADEKEGCVFLGWDKSVWSIQLIPGGPSRAAVPTALCANLEKMRSFLMKQGAEAGELQDDGGGHRYFEIRDCEGNTIEFYKEN
jgi:hypothetical protein